MLRPPLSFLLLGSDQLAARRFSPPWNGAAAVHAGSAMVPLYASNRKIGLRPCLDAACKFFENASFYIWSTKYRLITKIITVLVCKSRDESNEPN